MYSKVLKSVLNLMAIAVLAITDNLVNMVCKLNLRCFPNVPSLAWKAIREGASRQILSCARINACSASLYISYMVSQPQLDAAQLQMLLLSSFITVAMVQKLYRRSHFGSTTPTERLMMYRSGVG